MAGACSSEPAGKTAADSGTTASGSYPAAPYGTEVGQAVENGTFRGRKGGLATPRETFDLASYYAMRAAGKRYLVLNVAAFWCSPCKEEAKEMQSRIVPTYGPKGVAFLTIILEDASRRPATDANVDTWIETYGLTYPVANDDDGYVTQFFDKSAMPLNMIIDLQTMKIVTKVVGADLPRITRDLDRLLGG
jgi:thiol-disulfide isomerase/thioredoxin